MRGGKFYLTISYQPVGDSLLIFTWDWQFSNECQTGVSLAFFLVTEREQYFHVLKAEDILCPPFVCVQGAILQGCDHLYGKDTFK